MTSGGLGFLDCATCGHALVEHDFRPELDEPWCYVELPPERPDPHRPDAFRWCDCGGYQVPPGLFTFEQVVELLRAAGKNVAEMPPGIPTRERNHKATGRPRGRPPKAEQTGEVVLA